MFARTCGRYKPRILHSNTGVLHSRGSFPCTCRARASGASHLWTFHFHLKTQSEKTSCIKCDLRCWILVLPSFCQTIPAAVNILRAKYRPVFLHAIVERNMQSEGMRAKPRKQKSTFLLLRLEFSFNFLVHALIFYVRFRASSFPEPPIHMISGKMEVMTFKKTG